VCDAASRGADPRPTACDVTSHGAGALAARQARHLARTESTVDLTFDGAPRGLIKDFRPELPLLIRY
jgi:hypothetical protein